MAEKKNNTVATVKRLILTEGLGVEDISKKLGISIKRIYEIISKHNLPSNPSVYPGGKQELQMCNLLACGWKPADVATAFRLSLPALQRVIDTAKIRLKKEMEGANQKGRGAAGGLAGEEAPALPRNAGPSRPKRPARKSAKPRRKTPRRKAKA